MSHKHTIIYYTNNLIAKDILTNTLARAISTCEELNAQLLLISHFPITKDYEKIDLEGEEFYAEDGLGNKLSIYKYLVKDLELDIKIPYKAFVTGKLAYTLETIIKQLGFIVDFCDSEVTMLFEHDVFYPEDYPKIVAQELKHAELTYYTRRTFVNDRGFWNNNQCYYQSGVAGRTSVMKKVFKNKASLIGKDKKELIFEPCIKHPDFSVFRLGDFREDEIVLTNVQKLNDIMPEDQTLLDFKHKLNYYGYTYGDNLYYEHPYWGKFEPYKDMIESLPMSHEEFLRCGYGVAIF